MKSWYIGNTSFVWLKGLAQDRGKLAQRIACSAQRVKLLLAELHEIAVHRIVYGGLSSSFPGIPSWGPLLFYVYFPMYIPWSLGRKPWQGTAVDSIDCPSIGKSLTECRGPYITYGYGSCEVRHRQNVPAESKGI